MFMPGVGALDEVGLRLHLEHDVDQVLQLDVVGVRSVPAAPAEVIADAVLRDVAQGVVQCLYSEAAVASKGIEAHLDADAVPERG